MRRSACFWTVLGILLAAAAPGYAQGGTTTTIAGLVVDSSGAVVPGADVTVTHVGDGHLHPDGLERGRAFSFPGLQIGTYTVTVTLQGFKTFVVNNVVLTSGAGANVRATLEVGGLERAGRRRRRRRRSSRRSRTTVSLDDQHEPDHASCR